jgi:glycerophosphoryl diester phosphodiesterase
MVTTLPTVSGNPWDRYGSDVGVHPYLDFAGPIAFAHRGGAGVHPENSMAAFRHSVELGYTHLETDVHATADAVAVAFHDDRLDRVTDAEGRLADLPWAVVARARIAGIEPIPRLEDLLEAFPEVRFNLDPKSDSAVEPMVDVIRRTGSVERVCITSFSGRRTARAARALGVDACHGAGPIAIARLMARSVGVPVPWPDTHVAQVPLRYGPVRVVTRAFVRAVHRRDIKVHVWTVDETDEMERLLDLEVDGIMTDRPERLREVLSARGQWPPAPAR